MTIRHFRIFIAVASTESITKAAQLLYVTQPTVSVAIREMEQHYGTRFSTGLIKDYTLQKKERHY
ncbi:MAG: LysR family transcriptional regulator [Acutalibacteraceae bacterium]